MTHILSVSGLLPANVTPIHYAATGLFDGATLDPTTGSLDGDATSDQDGTMEIQAVGSDGSTTTISIPYSVTGVSTNTGGNTGGDTGGGSTPTPSTDVNIATVTALLTAINSNLLVATPTRANQVYAVSAFARIASIIVSDPTTDLMNLLTKAMVQYKDSVYDEMTFCAEMSELPKHSHDLAMAFYTTFRSITTNPSATPDVSSILSLTKSTAIIEYIESYASEGAANASAGQPTVVSATKVAGNYITPSIAKYTGATATLYIGAAWYDVAMSQGGVISMARDPNVSMPTSTTFFTVSEIKLDVGDGVISFDSSITLTAAVKAAIAALPTSGAYSVLMKVASFDGSKTFIVTDLTVL